MIPRSQTETDVRTNQTKGHPVPKTCTYLFDTPSVPAFLLQKESSNAATQQRSNAGNAPTTPWVQNDICRKQKLQLFYYREGS